MVPLWVPAYSRGQSDFGTLAEGESFPLTPEKYVSSQALGAITLAANEAVGFPLVVIFKVFALHN